MFVNKKIIFCALMALLGCSEYDIQGQISTPGAKPNPVKLETPIVVDTISQINKPKVDILYIVDNSCSMAEEQYSLSTNFPQFMNYFLHSDLDYHIGVTSTDMSGPEGVMRTDFNGSEGRLREAREYRYIDENTLDPVEIFSYMSVMGTMGSGIEEGRAAAYTALELKKDRYNSGFLREDAALHLIVISDERDWSSNTPIALDEFIRYLKLLKEDPEAITFSSIVGPPGGCYFGGSFSYAEEGTGYLEITDAIGGIKHSICSEDWRSILDDLGLLTSGLKREYFLSQLPVPDTVEVRVIDRENTFQFFEDDWAYNEIRNSITFEEYVPDQLAKVEITYELLSNQRN